MFGARTQIGHAARAYRQVKLPLASIEQQARQKLAELAGMCLPCGVITQ